VRQAGLDAGDAAGEHRAQAVGVEGAAKDGLDLVLEDGGHLVTAEVGHGCLGLGRVGVEGWGLSVGLGFVESGGGERRRGPLCLCECAEGVSGGEGVAPVGAAVALRLLQQRWQRGGAGALGAVEGARTNELQPAAGNEEGPATRGLDVWGGGPKGARGCAKAASGGRFYNAWALAAAAAWCCCRPQTPWPKATQRSRPR